MNASLNKQLHTLLTSAGLMNEKANLVLGFSNGRGESSKELTDKEAKEMIDWLQMHAKESDRSNKMRRKIISIAYEMHWAKAGDWKKAIAAIDTFCMGNKSLFKKALNKHSYDELVQVVSQFESMYKKYLKKF